VLDESIVYSDGAIFTNDNLDSRFGRLADEVVEERRLSRAEESPDDGDRTSLRWWRDAGATRVVGVIVLVVVVFAVIVPALGGPYIVACRLPHRALLSAPNQRGASRG
jgi:hypothetical protein